MNGRSTWQRRRAQRIVPAAPAQRQRGAAAVFAAIAMIAALAAMLLGINIGMLYYAQRNLQKLAVVSALAGAQISSGCRNGGVLGNTATVTSRVQNALINNATAAAVTLLGKVNGADPVELGWVNSSSGEALTDSAGRITYTAPSDNHRHFFKLPDGDSRINSVRVNLTQTAPSVVGAGLLPGVTGPVTLYASATAEQQAIGSFYLGTSLLSLNTSNSALLNPLLQGLLCGGTASSQCNAQVALIVASYQGLANADISLGNLLGSAVAANVGIKDLSSLLTTQLTLPQWLGILGNTLGSTVDGTTGQVSNGVSGLVQGLAGLADASGNKFGLGSILNTVGLDLNPAVSSVVGAVPFVDGLDLLAALGEAARASPDGSIKPITLGPVVSVPGTITLNSYLSIGAPPQFAIGPAGAAHARTAEITLMIRISAGTLISGLTTLVNNTVNGVLQLVGLLSLGLIQSNVTVLTPPLNLGVDVNVAPATASLDKLQCPTDTVAAPVAGLSGTTAIATINVGPFIGASTATPTPLSAANTYEWTLAEVKVNANALGLGSTDTQVILGLVSVGVGVTPVSFKDVTQYIVPPTGTPPSYVAYGAPSYPAASNGDNPQTVGSNTSVSLALSVYPKVVSGSGLLGVLSSLVSTLVDTLKTTLNGLLSLINGLLASVINPLLNLLGLQLGSATLIMNSVTVAPPVIVSTDLP
ncbi:MAG TPA: hypothetical protein VFA75_02545 [Nevskia sp.]|nr:hypothetical protein [Nevskia sp.]